MTVPLARVTLLSIAAGLLALPSRAQIVLEDRRLQGHVGFTNTTIVPPRISLSRPDDLEAHSVGRPSRLSGTGPLFDDGIDPARRAYEAVVEAFGGDYWLSVMTTLESAPPQGYRFGYAINRPGSPGYPTFEDAFVPFTQRVGPSDPDPLPSVDLLECAGRIALHFLEPDPSSPGEYRPATIPISASVEAHPRINPHSPGPFWIFSDSNPSGYADGGPQASAGLPPGTTDMTFLARASQQLPPRAGPDIAYQFRVRWTKACTVQNPACPGVTGSASQESWFAGDTGSLGWRTGYVAQSRSSGPGILVPCDAAESVQLYIVVTPCMPPCPAPLSGMDGCASLIGERELEVARHPGDSRPRSLVRFDWGHGSVSHAPLANAGESVPAHVSGGWLDRYTPGESEGTYLLEGIPTGEDGRFELNALLQPTSLPGRAWLQDFTAYVSGWLTPNGTATEPGADLCLAPGLYRGEVVLRDANGGRSGTGGLRALVEGESTLEALGDPVDGFINIPWRAARDHRGGAYDGATGTWTIPHDNVFASYRYRPVAWTERVLRQRFRNPSPDPARLMDGRLDVVFDSPTNAVTWDALDWVSTAAGGRWTGPVMPGTQLAPREARIVPARLELCYAKVRMQVRSTNVLFFRTTIASGTGRYSHDAGTPDPSDDTIYTADIRGGWRGTPELQADAAREGVVNLVLPAGRWDDVSGSIFTVLDPATNRVGTTLLPSVDLELGCGQTCTIAQNPQSEVPLATMCLDPVGLCNDPGVLARRIPMTGALFHQEPIVSGWWRVNGGARRFFDPAAAGVTCAALPCTDAFSLVVTDDESALHACLNRIELSFEDAAGLVVSGFLDVSIDTTPPTLRLPSLAPLPCGGRQLVCEGEEVPLPVATDDCSSEGDVDSRLVLLHDRPTTFPDGETLVTYRAIDGCGNETRCPVTVVVGGEGELTLECPPPLVIECTGPGGVPRTDSRLAAWLASVRADLPCGTLPVVADDAPATFPSGCGDGRTTTVTFSAVDAGGARVSCSSTVTVRDTTLPRVTAPPPLVLECVSPEGVPAEDPRLVAWLEAATASDACGTVDLAHDAPAQFPRGCSPGQVTLVRWTAVDSCGLVASAQSSVTVVDTLPPRLVVPPPLVLECTSPGGTRLDDPAVQAWLALARAEDDCGPATLEHDAPPLLPAGCAPGLTTPVRFVARDQCGLEVEGASSITVADTQPPRFDGLPRLGSGGPVVLWPPQHGYVVLDLADLDARASDACGELRLAFAGCASSQPEDTQGADNARDGGDGSTPCDCAISPDGQRVALRAERNGGCEEGRSYEVTVIATDACGHAATSPGFVARVPHDRRHRAQDEIVLHANPASHAPDDVCAEGWGNGAYPPPRPRGEGCGSP